MKRLLLCLPLVGCFLGTPDAPPPFEAPGPQGRYEAAVAFDTARGRMVMYGGLNEVGVQSTTWTFADGRWSRLPDPGPPARRGAAMAYDVERDRVVLFGGEVEGGASCAATWELAGDVWERVDTPGPSCRRDHAMTYDAEARRVLLFGGFGPEEGCEEGACQETWAYDGEWTRIHQPAR